MTWKTKSRALDLSRQAVVMGILNTTPDSFSDGGEFLALSPALLRARQMIAEGAGIIDIGGESSRPGATPVSESEEIQRTAPLIGAIRAEWSGLISIDTTKAAVASAALAAGADIVNDISGLTADPAMSGLCAEAGCGIVVMHMKGTPADMQKNPEYVDVVSEVRAFFAERLTTLSARGIDPERLCFDPGIGFGKTLEHNLELLRHLNHLGPAGRPLLLGVSRKSLISRFTDTPTPADRDAPTVALSCIARQKGVMLHRVHAVKANLDGLRMTEALLADV
jgi:dihydropteroate synthase